LASRPFAASERPVLAGLGRLIETVLLEAPADRLLPVRDWWGAHGSEFVRRLGGWDDLDLR
jgi:hypothetical protein